MRLSPNYFRKYAALISLSVLAACTKKTEKDPLADLRKRLPAVTTEGAMSFAVIMDDKWFFHSRGEYNAPPMSSFFGSCHGGNSAYTYGRKADIYATICPERELQFRLSLNTNIPGTYALSDTSVIEFEVEKVFGRGSGVYMNQTFENVYPAEGIFKLIRADSIYAGTFFGTVRDMNGSVLKLRDGRFDIKVTW
jgi:hypothetical protein